MFTLKLYRGHTVNVLEVESIQVYPAGPPDKMPDDPKDRTNDVREIVCVVPGKHTGEVFYITGDIHKMRACDFAVYNYAYLENANGKTTEKIYPY